jgi:hypothetical protein
MERGTGGWGQNILSWLQPSAEHRIVLQYADLIVEPTVTVMKVVKALGLNLQPRREALIPGFMELHQVDRGFFRRGINGSYLDEMPEDLQDLFWSKPENTAAMALIGCPIGNGPPNR